HPADAVDRQGRPLVVRGPASGGLRPARPARPDSAELLGLQPGLCPGPERACLECRADRYHARRDDAAGGRRESVQTGRRDIREIPDRIELRHQEGRSMTSLSRRSLLRSSLALTAAGGLVRPYIANAAATTAEVWWAQGFAQEEDVSFKKTVADYEKASGNTIDYSIIPFAPERQKIVSAVTSGVVPDLFQNNPFESVALFAWDDK